MGGNNTKALVAVNKLYPAEDGDITTIPGVDPILLQKEEEAMEDYEDEDEAIDQSLDIVWAEYDKKGEKHISKKVALQFFKDAMTLFAFRKGKEPKHIFAEKGVKEKDAYEKAFSTLSKDGKTVTYDSFKEFANMADLSDVLQLLCGQK